MSMKKTHLPSQNKMLEDLITTHSLRALIVAQHQLKHCTDCREFRSK